MINYRTNIPVLVYSKCHFALRFSVSRILPFIVYIEKHKLESASKLHVPLHHIGHNVEKVQSEW